MPHPTLRQRRKLLSATSCIGRWNAGYCPVPDFFDDGVGATVTATAVDEKAFRNGATTVTPRRVNHAPGVPIFGFRLDDGDRSMADIPDVEYLDDAHRRPALELADGVDLLIHDASHCDEV